MACHSTKGWETWPATSVHRWLFNIKQNLASVKVNSKITNDLRQNPGPIKVNSKIH